MSRDLSWLKVGCCGFPRGIETYVKRFNVVEVQQTFYQLPSRERVDKLSILAPSGFEFCIKAWQGVTHPASSPTYRRFKGRLEKPDNYGFFQQTDEVLQSWRETEEICSLLKARYVLFQCPARFKPTDKNLENMIWFFNKIKNPAYLFVWEPRGSDWSDEVVLEMCKKCGLIHCVDPFARRLMTEDFAYFRLHGVPPGDKMYYYDYTYNDLKNLLKICRKFEEVYCLFNNINMYKNALQLIDICKKEID